MLFVARWPGRVKADRERSDLVALTDLMATYVAVLGRLLPRDAGEDSFSFLPVLLGEKSG